MVIAGNREESGKKNDWASSGRKIIGAIATVWKEPWEVISVQRGNGALGMAYYLGQRHAGITLRELGRHVGEVEYPAVSLAIARFEKRLKTDRSLEKRLKQVIKLLNVEM